MPFLLLASGDDESKELLRRALEARYGIGAPAIDTLKIEFKGRRRTKLGPIMTWVPIDGYIYFNAPMAARWDHTMRPVGLPLNTVIDAFDGTIYRKRRGGRDDIEVVTDSEVIQSIQRCLWAASALLLTPLVEQHIELRSLDERSFSATNTETDDTAHVTLNADHTVQSIMVEAYNAAEDEEQKFTLQAENGQTQIGDLMVPAKLVALWDDVPEIEVEAVAIEVNPELDEDLFRLDD
ncbi:MAG: hypothetical protein GYB67_11630 [Chloroflexi bacterium]|nr:hypothetical protein [Chloroflexota bacterium]